MPRYKVGPIRLYIDKTFHEPGSEFSTSEPLPNEQLLVDVGNVAVISEKRATAKPEADS